MAEKEYIEREAAQKVLADHYAYNAAELLDTVPIADVQEVRHGKWIEQLDGTHYCSYCGRDATYTFDGNEVCGITCTYCGAKMDKECEK